jgi:hypothetical protein
MVLSSAHTILLNRSSFQARFVPYGHVTLGTFMHDLTLILENRTSVKGVSNWPGKGLKRQLGGYSPNVQRSFQPFMRSMK